MYELHAHALPPELPHLMASCTQLHGLPACMSGLGENTHSRHAGTCMHAMHGSLAAARASRRRPQSAARGYMAALVPVARRLLKRLQHDHKRWLRDSIHRRRCCCCPCGELHGPCRSGEDLGAKSCLRSCFTCFLRRGHCRCRGLQKSWKRSSTRGAWCGSSGRRCYVWQSLLPGSCCRRAR